VSTPRYWTLEEAQAALPRIRELLEILRKAANLATLVRSNGHARLDLDGDSPATAPLGTTDGGDEEMSPVDIQPVLEEIEQSGIVVRDPTRGLIDFPSVHLGRTVQLCWQLGEEDIGWWHLPEDGFAGRRPLPLPSEW
jgi:hypothetical protein